ncbi:hypothetical protein SEA_LUCKYSOCKE_203 [Streptomyces phage LuckySocke]|nr:hypothetical protein SEA_ALONE_206 [Streptomyces phage Alone3]WPH58865.1 hypothetical protein SEA_LUCKYSOCKE_203 [Streptomyces phage LuckySocke]
MRMPEFPLYHNFPDTIKGREAEEKNRTEWYAYWEWMRNRRFHALPEDKGIPVPGTGTRRYRKSRNGSGVSASSRVLSHYYADEGEKGRTVRKLVRNRERALWLSEWQEERNEDAEYGYARDVYSAGDWFSDDPYMWDWYYGEDDYDREDFYPVDWRDLWEYADYCETCNGPCEL